MTIFSNRSILLMQLPNQFVRKPTTNLNLTTSPITAVTLGFAGVVVPLSAIIYNLFHGEKEKTVVQRDAAHVEVPHMYLPILWDSGRGARTNKSNPFQIALNSPIAHFTYCSIYLRILCLVMPRLIEKIMPGMIYLLIVFWLFHFHFLVDIFGIFLFFLGNFYFLEIWKFWWFWWWWW